jgi:hypothetical protein
LTTNCVFPPELDEKQLLAYLDDPQANPATARHLEGCPHCRERADALQHFQKKLTTRLYRSTCPPPLELGEFHMRMLPAPQRLVIAQHVRECPLCTQEISQLGGFMSEPEPRTNAIKELIARLVNSGARMGSAQAFPALRGEVKAPPIFEADGLVITLDVQPSQEGEIAILGQMAADDQDRWTGATVELKQPYLAPLQASVDDLGAFTFNTVDPGSLEMTITSPDGMVVRTDTILIT